MGETWSKSLKSCILLQVDTMQVYIYVATVKRCNTLYMYISHCDNGDLSFNSDDHL